MYLLPLILKAQYEKGQTSYTKMDFKEFNEQRMNSLAHLNEPEVKKKLIPNLNKLKKVISKIKFA